MRFFPMGKAFSALRPKTNIEKLDTLVETISHLEEVNDSLKQKREIWTENIAAYGTGFYFLIGSLIYFFRFPNDKASKISYAIGYALYPILLIIIKEFIGWFFKIRVSKTSNKINKLKREKKEILDSIMKIEPFKSFKNHLDKSEKNGVKDKPLDKRKLQNEILTRPASRKSLLEKIFEYVIGEGTNSRYALICGKCGHHNGLALEEEFEYIFFKCCSCYYYNPARKMRPESPKLLANKESSISSCEKSLHDELLGDGETISTKVLMKPHIDKSSTSVMERVGKWQNILGSLSER